MGSLIMEQFDIFLKAILLDVYSTISSPPGGSLESPAFYCFMALTLYVFM
jgi:hypothetical protein